MESVQKEKQQVIEEFKQEFQYPFHPYRHKKGGMNMSFNQDSGVAKAIIPIIKQISARILSGDIKNVMTISKPAIISTEHTFMEVIAYDNYATGFLDKAAKIENNPIERMQYLVAFFLSGQSYIPTKVFNRVPLDPAIGETLALKKKNGTQFYSECINARPPCFRASMYSKNGDWQFQYKHQLVATLLPPNFNSLTGTNKGRKMITFKNGEVYISKKQQAILVEGIIVGDRVVNCINTVEIYCEQTNLLAIVKYCTDTPDSTMKKISNMASKVKGIFGKWGSKKQESLRERDDFDVTIFKVFKQVESEKPSLEDDELLQAPVSTGNGNWCSYLQFEGIIIWKITDFQDEWSKNSDQVLPSDGHYREDKQLMKKKDYDNAQKIIDRLFQQDLDDQKLRDKYTKQQQQQAKK